MESSTLMFIGYVAGSITTYLLFRKHWVTVGANATLDMLMQNNFLKWRKVNGEIEFLQND